MLYQLTNYKCTLIRNTNASTLRNHQGRNSNVMDGHVNVKREKGMWVE